MVERTMDEWPDGTQIVYDEHLTDRELKIADLAGCSVQITDLGLTFSKVYGPDVAGFYTIGRQWIPSLHGDEIRRVADFIAAGVAKGAGITHPSTQKEPTMTDHDDQPEDLNELHPGDFDTPPAWRTNADTTTDEGRARAALHARIENDFAPHPPKTDETRDKLNEMASWFEAVGHFAIDNCPPSRELWLCLTNLEAAKRDAIAAIACHQDD